MEDFTNGIISQIPFHRIKDTTTGIILQIPVLSRGRCTSGVSSWIPYSCVEDTNAGTIAQKSLHKKLRTPY